MITIAESPFIVVGLYRILDPTNGDAKALWVSVTDSPIRCRRVAAAVFCLFCRETSQHLRAVSVQRIGFHNPACTKRAVFFIMVDELKEDIAFPILKLPQRLVDQARER